MSASFLSAMNTRAEDAAMNNEIECCVGCGKDGLFPENRDGDTMCECCMSDEEDAYLCCRDCDYTWDTKAYWEAGKGRVAFCYPAEDIEDGDVVCSLCYKRVHEYYPTDDEEESDEECA